MARIRNEKAEKTTQMSQFDGLFGIMQATKDGQVSQ
jgi:hypothetical protein